MREGRGGPREICVSKGWDSRRCRVYLVMSFDAVSVDRQIN